MRSSTAGAHPVASLPLPRRAINALTDGGISTLEETRDWSDEALLSLRQFGPSYLTAVRAMAAESNKRQH